MTNYTCKCCNFSTTLKANYERHLKTKKHKKMENCHPKFTILSPKNTIFDTPKSPLLSPIVTKKNKSEYNCKYCGSKFKFRQGMYRHIKYTCKQNKDEDLKELVKLMNEKLIDIKREVDDNKKEIEKKDKMIQKLSTKLQITNYNNMNCIVNNIQLLNYEDTDTSHLTSVDYERALNQVNNAIPSIVRKIHFNPSKPENMNVYIPNIKDKYILIFNGNEWQLKNRSKELNTIIDDKYRLLKEWYDENMEDDEETYLFLKNNFQKFDESIGDDEQRNEIKEEIIMFMYNKRNLIIKNSQEQNIQLLEN